LDEDTETIYRLNTRIAVENDFYNGQSSDSKKMQLSAITEIGEMMEGI
jgi:hypothetical protein